MMVISLFLLMFLFFSCISASLSVILSFIVLFLLSVYLNFLVENLSLMFVLLVFVGGLFVLTSMIVMSHPMDQDSHMSFSIFWNLIMPFVSSLIFLKSPHFYWKGLTFLVSSHYFFFSFLISVLFLVLFSILKLSKTVSSFSVED